jgi:hypothetical protein
MIVDFTVAGMITSESAHITFHHIFKCGSTRFPVCHNEQAFQQGEQP